MVLDLKGKSPATDYFVIATGTSNRQMRSVADDISAVLGDGISVSADKAVVLRALSNADSWAVGNGGATNGSGFSVSSLLLLETVVYTKP